VLHDVPKISWKIKDKKCFMSLHFSTLKNSQMENKGAICCSLSFQVEYCIWHIWPAVFEFDRPDICEGGVLEWWIEQNGLKLWGPMCLKGCGTSEYVCVCVCEVHLLQWARLCSVHTRLYIYQFPNSDNYVAVSEKIYIINWFVASH